MGDTTRIAWADHTWNFWRGCSDVHTGCTNCYAKRDRSVQAHGIEWGPRGTRALAAESTREKPKRWNRAAIRNNTVHRPRVFPSLMDPFEIQRQGMRLVTHDGDLVWINELGGVEYHPAEQRPGTGQRYATLDDARREMYDVVDDCLALDFLMLTKRPEQIGRLTPPKACTIYRDNVWLLASASDQETCNRMAVDLLAHHDSAPVVGLSLEPLIRPIDLGSFINDDMKKRLDWVIVGGESGPGARFCDRTWIINLVTQCNEWGVPVFVKQAGDNSNIVTSAPKGGDPNEWPTLMRFQQYPQPRRRQPCDTSQATSTEGAKA